MKVLAGGRALWLLAAAALLPYLNCLPNDFALDDYGLIVENVAVAAGDVVAFFTRDYWSGYDAAARSGLYRPVTLLSFAAEHALFGPWPLPFRVTNLLLHLGTTLLAWHLFRRLAGDRAALWGAALFAVLPGHSEAVIAIAGRADLLATAGSLAALVCLTGAAGWRSLLSGSVCFAVALLSKESAAVTPALLLAIGWLQHRRQLQPWRWSPLVATACVLVLYLWVRYLVLGDVANPDIDPLDNPLVALSGLERVLAALAVVTRYAVLLVAPAHLSADYSFAAIAVSGAIGPHTMAGVALVGLLTAAAVQFIRQPQTITLGLVWLAIGMAPFVNVLFPIGTILAERLTYAPSAGFALSMGSLLGARSLGACRYRLWRLAGTALLLIMAARTTVRCADWRNEVTLFQAVVDVFPDSARGHKGLAKALGDVGQTAAAEAHYRRAIDIYPDFETAHYNLGNLLHQTARYDAALQHFERACSLRPEFADAHLNRGAALFQLGRVHDALAATRQAVGLRPDWQLARQNLADIEAVLARRPDATQPGGRP